MSRVVVSMKLAAQTAPSRYFWIFVRRYSCDVYAIAIRYPGEVGLAKASIVRRVMALGVKQGVAEDEGAIEVSRFAPSKIGAYQQSVVIDESRAEKRAAGDLVAVTLA